MKKNKFEVLLYYKYVHLGIPEKVRADQMRLCKKLNLKGRIIVAGEGINGTVEGLIENTEEYIREMNKIPEFQNINFKRSIGTGESFPRLSVKVRSEIVTLGRADLDPNKITGKYITSEELHNWYLSGKEFYVVDMRNDYEQKSGYFQDSILSNISNFRDLPDFLPKIEHLKDKTVVTVCTGGVRCEKASGFLVENNFSDVYQLKDGIATYMEKYPNEHFLGKLYVFDKRLTIAFNAEDSKHKVVGMCDKCGVACDMYVNCELNTCHRHYICCVQCVAKTGGIPFCDKKCWKKHGKIFIA